MRATSQPISAIVGWPIAEPGLAPQRGIGSGLQLLSSVAAVLRKKCQALEALQRSWLQRPTGNGGPPAPNGEDPVYDSIWDDPLLWMLMMH